MSTDGLNRGYAGRLVARHGKCGTKVHTAWLQMRARCNNPRHPWYGRYGGRGVRICERWNNFENFLADMGEPPSNAQLERINNDGNYEPANCVWADRRTQMNNTSRNRYYTCFGLTKTIAQWARETGLNYYTMMDRLKKQGPEAALEPFKAQYLKVHQRPEGR
jgi:hypothetical protein